MTERLGNTVVQLRNNAEREQEHTQFFPRAQGHEKILAGCKKNRALMRLHLIANKESIDGYITQFDRWTITIRQESNGELRTFYKHALESFEKAD